MLRIISGKYGGRIIETPDGKKTRPTTNRTREAVFNSLCSNFSDNMTLEGAIVLDMFAGSGALGFEALSRSAKFVTFCDKSPKAISIIKKNAKTLNVESDRFEVVCIDSLKPKTYNPKPNLIFADPPYAFSTKKLKLVFDDMLTQGMIATPALIYYEHAEEADLSCFTEKYELIYRKRCADIFRVC